MVDGWRSDAFYEARRDELEKRVGPRRFKHSLGVSETAEKLARVYGADETAARVAGLLHDWDKGYDDPGILARADELGMELDAELVAMPRVLHGLTAAVALGRAFPELPPEVLAAVERHTLGDAGMSDLDMIVYIADALEPGRKGKVVEKLREKIGVMYGNPEVTTGGRALKFYSSVRMEVRRIEPIKDGGEIIGNRTRAKVVKNKVAPPFREAEFDIMYGEGIAHTGELIDLGVRLGIITKAGSWFSMGEVRIGQGRDAAKKYLEENPDIAADVEAQIRANFDKLMGNQSRIAAAKAAGKAVNVSADDFNDED